MAIQHRDIPEQELHEPKGASLAPPGTVYVATGSGSGSWGKISTDSIEGVGSQQGSSGMALVSNGSGGFTYALTSAYGSMVINDNSGNFPITEANDSSLNTNSDYKIVSGTGAPWSPDLSHEVAIGSDSITIVHDGVYKVETWMDIVSFPTNTSRLALKYVVNGNQYSLRKVSVKSNSGGDAGSLTGFGLVSLSEGDVIQVAVASTHNGNIIFESGNVTISLVRAL